MVDDNLQIGELAKRAGVSVRTIRYYIEEGLLPPPSVEGRYSVFDEGYLNRLQLILRLKEAYLPLREIRDLITHLDDGEVARMLRGETPMPTPPPPSIVKESASEYIQNLLGARPAASRIADEKRHLQKPQLLAQEEDQEPPAVILFQTRRIPGEDKREDDSDPIPNLNESSWIEDWMPELKMSDEAQPSTWQRIELADGVELHLRQPADQQTEHLVARLIRQAKSIFQDRQGGKTAGRRQP